MYEDKGNKSDQWMDFIMPVAANIPFQDWNFLFNIEHLQAFEHKYLGVGLWLFCKSKFYQRQHQEIMNINSILLITNHDTSMYLAQRIHIFTV